MSRRKQKAGATYIFSLYSPSCREEVFSETHLQNPAKMNQSGYDPKAIKHQRVDADRNM